MSGQGGNYLGVFSPRIVRTGGNFAHDVRGRRVIEVTSATYTCKDGETGALFLCNRAAGIAFTLPTRPRQGCLLEFLVIASFSGGSGVWTSGLSTELHIGEMEMADTDSSDVTVTYRPDQSNDRIITFNGTTTGGLIGSHFSLEYVRRTNGAVGNWFVKGVTFGSGAVQIPFS